MEGLFDRRARAEALEWRLGYIQLSGGGTVASPDEGSSLLLWKAPNTSWAICRTIAAPGPVLIGIVPSIVLRTFPSTSTRISMPKARDFCRLLSSSGISWSMCAPNLLRICSMSSRLEKILRLSQPNELFNYSFSYFLCSSTVHCHPCISLNLFESIVIL